MTELYSNQANVLHYDFMVEGVPMLAHDLDIKVRTGNDCMTWTDPVSVEIEDEPMGDTKYVISNTLLNNSRYAHIGITYSIDGYGNFVDTFIFPIVKRYVTFGEINKILGEEFALTWDDYVEVERNVRFNIDNYCMQSFNSWSGTQIVYGTGGYIQLPQHLSQLDTLSPSYPTPPNQLDPFNGFALTEPGFFLLNPDMIKTVSMFGGKPHPTTYSVTGTWGYTSVPAAVRSAAIELFKSNLCDDKQFRNRYIDNIRNENVRIQLRAEAYSGDTTGNAFADDILSPYKLLSIGVI